mgnify:FL=1
MKKVLSAAGKEQVAVALDLLYQWKAQDGQRMNADLLESIIELAEILGVKEEHARILSIMPRFTFVKIE